MLIQQIKDTVFVRLFAFLKIPLLWWVRPRMIENSNSRVVLMIPLFRRTKNHLGSMYFGALAMGAEAAVAITAIQEIQKSKMKIDFIFKAFSAEFLKRADGDVHFICENVESVAALVAKAAATGERETQEFTSYAIVPSNDTSVKVAEFKVTLSLKKRN
jgi:hypothetical protein